MRHSYLVQTVDCLALLTPGADEVQLLIVAKPTGR